MDKYCLYTDLKELYGKVMPAIKSFEDKLIEYDEKHLRNEEIIRGYDEVMSTKAGKTDYFNLRGKAEYHAKRLDELHEQDLEQMEESKLLKSEFRVLNDTLKALEESMAIQIYDGVKKAIAK